MICPRCDGKNALQLTRAQDSSWEIYGCPSCNFTWRDLEGDYVTDPSRYNPSFKLKVDELDKLMVSPPVPPLAK